MTIDLVKSSLDLVVKAHEAAEHAERTLDPDAFGVAADAWEEAGYPSVALGMRYAARMSRKGIVLVGANREVLDLLGTLPVEPRWANVNETDDLARRTYSGQPMRELYYPLGFQQGQGGGGGGFVTIPKGVTLRFLAQPQIPIRVNRFVIQASSYDRMLVLDVRVGKNDQFANAMPLPLAAFSPRAYPLRWELDTADISQFVSINIVNQSDKDVDVCVCATGRAVE